MNSARAIFAALALTALPLQSLAQDFHKGMSAYDQDEFEIAYQELRPLAEQGDAHAQYIVGMMYLFGDGVSKDEAEGWRWIQLVFRV